LLAAIITATTPLFLAHARTVIFDTTLAFFVCGAIFAGYFGEVTQGRASRNWYRIGALSAGLATLVKGPVGFLIPVLVLLVFNRVEGHRGAWRRLLAPMNLLVFLAVTLPWFVGLCLKHRDFFFYGLVEETFNRFTTAKTFHRAEPVYFYLLIIAGTFFPWSLFLPESSLAVLKQRWSENKADRLCVLWSILTVVFFSVSQSKLPGYILSVTVACGILVARVFEAAMARPEGKAAQLVGRATAVFGIICLLLAAVAVLGASHSGLLARPLRIPVADAERLAHWALPVAVVCGVFGVVAWVARHRHSPSLCFLCLALFPPLVLNINLGMIEVVIDAKSGRCLANQLSTMPLETEVACLECFPNGLPFYLCRTAILVSRDGSELTSNYIVGQLKKAVTWPQNIVPTAEFNGWLASRRTPVYLIASQDSYGTLAAIAAARGATVQPLARGFMGAQLPAKEGH
jgi:hypothetical protein